MVMNCMKFNKLRTETNILSSNEHSANKNRKWNENVYCKM
jgi:hypothetical protein